MRIFLTPFQPATLTVMPTHPHSTLTGRLDSFAGSFSLTSNRPCGLTFFWTLLVPPHPTVLTAMPDHPHSLQPAVPILMTDHSHSHPAGSAESYLGPSSLIFNRRCSPLCFIIQTPHQPSVLIVMPAPPHFLPTGRADCYAVPSSLDFNRCADSYASRSSFPLNRPC